jgi:RNA polymerase sigma factor (sigma-70 family)
MFAVAYRILRNHADVEDVVGGVFIKVWFQANRFNPARGSARAWLATMCRNASIDWIRRGATRSHRELSDSELELEFDSTHSPELQIEKSQLGLAVSHALSRLPRLQRQVVELAFYRGLSHSEISLAAKLPLGTVKSHLRRSLIQLHRDLDTGNSRRNQHGPAALKLM